jgi:hypothetical protein
VRYYKTRLAGLVATMVAIEVMFAAAGVLRSYPFMAALPVILQGATIALTVAAYRRDQRAQRGGAPF